jgi:hypothetical protein
MTKKKDFKRAVREYASRTGRSYTSARRQLLSRDRGGVAANDPASRTISRPELGFAVALPEGWSEFPRPFSSSPFEVARFACHDRTTHVCIVFRMPGSPGLHPRGIAERSRARLAKRGFGNFALGDADVGGKAGVLLTCDKTIEEGLWAAREYFVTAGSLVYCLGLGSGDPAGDAAVFDCMASGFEVTG